MTSFHFISLLFFFFLFLFLLPPPVSSSKMAKRCFSGDITCLFSSLLVTMPATSFPLCRSLPLAGGRPWPPAVSTWSSTPALCPHRRTSSSSSSRCLRRWCRPHSSSPSPASSCVRGRPRKSNPWHLLFLLVRQPAVSAVRFKGTTTHSELEPPQQQQGLCCRHGCGVDASWPLLTPRGMMSTRTNKLNHASSNESPRLGNTKHKEQSGQPTLILMEWWYLVAEGGGRRWRGDHQPDHIK